MLPPQLDSNSFAHLADVIFTPHTKLFQSSWCPTMDLFVVAAPLSNRHRLALWKMGGVKVWDVEVGRGDTAQENIVGIAWSPNGLQIAVIHHPPRLTFHSCHDGREISSLDIPLTQGSELTGIWWFKHDSQHVDEGGISGHAGSSKGSIAGTSESTLRLLPSLDGQQNSTVTSTTRILNLNMARNGVASQRAQETYTPPEFRAFPTLPPDLLAASISPDTTSAPSSTSGIMNNIQNNDGHANTVVVVSDDAGHIYPFLDGSYPLGIIDLGRRCNVVSVWKLVNEPSIFIYTKHLYADPPSRCVIFPTAVHMSLLSSGSVLRVARASSIVRSLTLYVRRAVGEMRRTWYGHESIEGGRDVGTKWINVLQEKEKQLDGSAKRTNPLFELTNLLFTGKTSSAMREFLGGSGKLSERGMAQWQGTVMSALVLIQESAERGISPAFERLIIVLEEVRGWSAWPRQYGVFGFGTADLNACLDLCHRGIELAEWLSKEAVAECQRFSEFMRWIKAEASRVNDGVVSDLRAPIYDPLEVSEYLEHGLLNSSIDMWFTGTAPKQNSSPIKADQSASMDTLMAEVRSVINSASDLDSPSTRHRSMEYLSATLQTENRNLQALIEELSLYCCRIFKQASATVGKFAIVDVDTFTVAYASGKAHPEGQIGFEHCLVRDRFSTISEAGQEPRCIQYTAMAAPSSAQWKLVLTRMEYATSHPSGLPTAFGASVFECRTSTGSAVGFQILDLDFFDDNTLLTVMRSTDEKGSNDLQGNPYLTSMDYTCIEYTNMQLEEVLIKLATGTREELMIEMLRLCEIGKLAISPLPVVRSRELRCCATGGNIVLAVNGRENRRCACILDQEGRHAEIFDIDAEGDDDDTEEGHHNSDDGDLSKEDFMEE